MLGIKIRQIGLAVVYSAIAVASPVVHAFSYNAYDATPGAACEFQKIDKIEQVSGYVCPVIRTYPRNITNLTAIRVELNNYGSHPRSVAVCARARHDVECVSAWTADGVITFDANDLSPLKQVSPWWAYYITVEIEADPNELEKHEVVGYTAFWQLP